MRLAVAAQAALHFLVAGRQQRHCGHELELREIGDAFEIAALRLFQRSLGDDVSVERHARAGERAQVQRVFSRGQAHDSGRACEEWRGAIDAHAGCRVFVRDVRKGERALRELIRAEARQHRPCLVRVRRGRFCRRGLARVVRGPSKFLFRSLRKFKHLHAHLALRQFPRRDDCGRQRQCLAFRFGRAFCRNLRRLYRQERRHRADSRGVDRHALRGQRAAVDRQFINPPRELRARRAAHRTADPYLVIVHDRRARRSPAHVPRALHFLAIDPAAYALRLAKFVSQHDMMPRLARLKSARGRPAVPSFFPGVLAVVEDEARACEAALPAQAQRPVLVVRRRARQPRAALADDVHIFPVHELPALHPRFDGNGVAIFKIEHALRARILHAQERVARVAREIRRRVFLREIRERRRPRPCFRERDLVARVRARPLVRLARSAAFLDAVEAPVRRRLVREHEVAVARFRGVCGGENGRRECEREE